MSARPEPACAPPIPRPPYGTASLGELLPSVAASMGLGDGVAPALGLPPASRVCVALVDGLGAEQLLERSGHAPFLRSVERRRTLTAGYPATTATSMGSFGTGLPPGGHGLVGYQVLDPARGVLLNELRWDPAVDPYAWQPAPTVLQAVAEQGVPVTMIGPAFFAGSGLTEAALRGAEFVAAHDLPDRVDACLAALRATSRALVYLYWGDVDKAGHVHGVASWEWGEEVASVDAELGRLARGLPPGSVLHVVADHGMVDVPHSQRLDLATEPDLADGVWLAGGEPRALHLYCEPGAGAAVQSRWQSRLGDRMWVLQRHEAIEAGWFGPVAEHVMPRIGDVVTAARGPFAVVDSAHQRPELLRLIGLHGGFDPGEALVPLLTVTATRRG